MKNTLLASAFVLIAAPALAQNSIGPIDFGGQTNGNFQVGNPSAISTGQIGSNSSATGGRAAATSGANATGGGGQGGAAAVTNNIGGGSYPSTIRNTPAATLALATAYCQNSFGGNIVGPGIGANLAIGRHDIDCKRLNYAMLLASLGDVEAAVLLISNNVEVNAAVTESRKRAAARPVQVAYTLPSYCTPTPNETPVDRLMRRSNCGRAANE